VNHIAADPVGEYVTFVVRVFINSDNELIQGEVISLEETTLGRFRDWEGEIRILNDFLNARPPPT